MTRVDALMCGIVEHPDEVSVTNKQLPRGGAGVADEQRPAVTVLQRLPLGLGLVDHTFVTEREVAVRVDQGRHDPAHSD